MKKITLFILTSLAGIAGFAQLKEGVGIGVRFAMDSTRGYKIPVVTAIIPKGPAEAAGVLPRDFILSVNGQSTRDVVQEEVAKMIAGEEGTTAQLVIERSGSTRNYTILRQKYKYATSFYDPTLKDDEFCIALAKLMNDAPYDFDNTTDTLHYTDEPGAFGRRYYECKVKVPGVEIVSIAHSFGTTCEIQIGTLDDQDQVNAAAEGVVAKIKTCFPNYYYEPVVEATGSNTVEIGKVFSNGFEGAILQLFSYESGSGYKLMLRINGGTATRYYQSSSAPQDNSFAQALRKIYNDVLNGFSNVKGTRHDVPGVLFSMGYTWYEVTPMPEGAHDCSITEGSLTDNGCRCRFYSGTDRSEAIESYNALYEKVYYALGSEFVHSFEKPTLNMTIPDNAEGVVTFGIKKRQTYESLPLLAIVVYEDTEGHWAVNMLIHKYGF